MFSAPEMFGNHCLRIIREGCFDIRIKTCILKSLLVRGIIKSLSTLFQQGCIFWPGVLFFSPLQLKKCLFSSPYFSFAPHPPWAFNPPPPPWKSCSKAKRDKCFVPKKLIFLYFLSFQIWYYFTKNFWGSQFYTD